MKNHKRTKAYRLLKPEYKLPENMRIHVRPDGGVFIRALYYTKDGAPAWITCLLPLVPEVIAKIETQAENLGIVPAKRLSKWYSELPGARLDEICLEDGYDPDDTDFETPGL